MPDLEPVIIIGAARSGTNMLRDVVASLPGYGTWPCDEINYIWRHGNARYPTDEFLPDMATEPIKRFVHAAFSNIAARHKIDHVVEKTCANSLRVRYVDRIFPQARFVSILRDGRDVVASALKRWSAPLDLPYILRKARYVPVSDVPYYGFSYLGNRIYRLNSGKGRLQSWGPRFDGMQEQLDSKSLAEVCAAQWQRSVERSEQDFARIDPARILHLRYETFVADPISGLQTLTQFLGVELAADQAAAITEQVSASNIGKWRRDLSDSDVEFIAPYVSSLLQKNGYA